MEHAQYYRNKFFRNGIASLILVLLLIFSKLAKTPHHVILICVFTLSTCFWLFTSYKIEQKLKTGKLIYPLENKNYRLKQIIVELVFAISFILTINKIPYSIYFLFFVIIIYSIWLYNQIKIINQSYRTGSN